MKTLITLLVALVAPAVFGQLVTLSTPYTSAANGVSNPPAGSLVLDVRRQQNVAVEWTFNVGGSDVTNCAVMFVGSPSSTSIPTSLPLDGAFLMTRASGGTTNIVVVTNFNVKGHSFLHLAAITNNSATMVLTNTFRYVVKPNAP